MKQMINVKMINNRAVDTIMITNLFLAKKVCLTATGLIELEFSSGVIGLTGNGYGLGTTGIIIGFEGVTGMSGVGGGSGGFTGTTGVGVGGTFGSTGYG